MKAVLDSARLLTMVMLLAGCVPVVGVSGGKDGDEIVFAIASCAVPWHDLPVRDISVFKAGTGPQGLAPDCRLSSTTIWGTVLHRWSYGTQPNGFRLDACAPLVVGQTYEVDVDAVGRGQREFRVTSGGGIAWSTWFACW